MLETSITIQALLNIGIVGATLSVVIEAINHYFSNSPAASKAITIVMCLVTAGGYWWLTQTPYLPTVVVILSGASLVYAFVYNRKSA